MGFQTIVVERHDGIVTVTLNRPPVNAINTMVRDELRAVCEEVDRDDTARVVILTGSGDRAFAAGADIREIGDQGRTEAEAMAQSWHALCTRMEGLDKPIIAAVNGVALGGGCELAMACDLRVASENARFGQPEINLGIIPGAGGTQRLPRLIGRGRALELMMTGAMIDAAEAYRIGLVNRVVPAADLMTAVQELAQTLASKGAIALRLMKECVNAGLDRTLDAALAFEARRFGEVCSTEDKAEGIAAFLEKRQPTFKGR
ncbi:MAG: enoyl-CoA hydratase/isomerase family protein [Candidatus Latescibacteria bacterium]|nr:enoyl-CoA hydratase/isomerase family protein [Candidatus Latescibacterota bacterium]